MWDVLLRLEISCWYLTHDDHLDLNLTFVIAFVLLSVGPQCPADGLLQQLPFSTSNMGYLLVGEIEQLVSTTSSVFANSVSTGPEFCLSKKRLRKSPRRLYPRFTIIY